MFKKTLLSIVSLLTFLLVSSAVMAQAPFTTTTIVNGNLSPVANGAALLAAVAAATPPALVKVEPGHYDLAGGQLVMQDKVDIEGSGRDVTFIKSDVSVSPTNATVVVPAMVTAQLRGLTVQNKAPVNGTGVRIESDTFLLTGMNVEVDVGTSGIGVDVSNCNTVINDVFVRIERVINTGTGPSVNIGFRLYGGKPILGDSFSLVELPSLRNIALEIGADTVAQVDQFFGVVGAGGDDYGAVIKDTATVDLRNTRLTAKATAPDINPHAYGLFVSGEASVDIKESTVTALSDALSVALQLVGDVSAKTTGTTFIAGPVNNGHTSVYAAMLYSSASLDSNQSNFESTSVAAANWGAGTARFGASQLIGSISAVSPTSFQCVFSYSGSYTARAANCL